MPLFLMFLKEVSYDHQGCMYLIKVACKIAVILFIIKLLYFNIFLNVIYSCDAKLNFQHHYSSLQCHMILQKSLWYAE